MTDAGRTYINPGPKHGVNHQMVEHNQFFVKKEGFHTGVALERSGCKGPYTIEGALRTFKTKAPSKERVRIRGLDE